MGFFRKSFLFAVGACSYVTLELLWRGRSHSSMFFAGGTCFLLLGKLQRAEPKLPVPARAVVGSGIITGVELLTGILANRDYAVWDYRNVPMNYHGQICLPYSLLWLPVSLGAMALYEKVDKSLPEKG